MDPFRSLDAGSLDEQTRFLRKLARGLLGNAADAEDAVQMAWVSLLEGRANEVRSPRAWLTTTVRHAAQQLRRSEGRRRTRERLAAKREELPATVETIGRLEATRSLLDALQRLDEPYRRIVLARFLDGLPPREIARREQVPVNTVRTWCRRGIERMRTELHEQHKDHLPAFLGALVPLATDRANFLIPTAWLPTVFVMTSLKLGLIAASVLLAAVMWWGLANTAPDGTEPGDAGATLVADRDVPTGALPVVSEDPVSQVEGVSKEGQRAAVAASPLERWTLAGIVRRGGIDGLSEVAVRISVSTAANGENLLAKVVETDSAGFFQVEVPALEMLAVVRLQTDLPHYTTVSRKFHAAPGREPTDPIVLDVYPLDRVLEGIVRDEVGAPIEGAFVEGMDEKVRSDEDGRFRIRTSSLLDTTQVKAHAEGHVPKWVTAMNGSQELLEIELPAAIRAFGRVLDPAGAPVAGARVRTFHAFGIRVTTDSAGRFEFPHLDPDSDREMLIVEADGFPRLLKWFTEMEAFAEEVVLQLEEGSQVEGVVRDTAGAPLVGVELFIGPSGSDVSRVDAVSDDAGEFRFPPLLPGSHELVASCRGFAPLRTTIELPHPADPAPTVELVLEPGHFLGGRVVDSFGRPMDRVSVIARYGDDYIDSRDTTDSDGRFRLDDLPAGEIEIELYGKRVLRAKHRPPAIDRNDVVFVAELQSVLAGRVVDATTGVPIPRFKIRLTQPNGGSVSASWSAGGRAIESWDGSWSADGISLSIGQQVLVTAVADGYAPCDPVPASASGSPDPNSTILRLQPAVRVEGVVVDARTGRAVEGARVLLVKAGTPVESVSWQLAPADPRDGRKWTHSRADGSFSLEAPPGEEVGLHVSHPSWGETVDGPFESPMAGVAAPRRIELHPGFAIAGAALDDDGAPLAGQQVFLTSPADAELLRLNRSANTDEDGRFDFQSLPAGRYELSFLSWSDGWGVPHRLVVVELPSGEDPVYVELGPEGGCTLRGTVICKVGPTDRVVVELHPHDRELQRRSTIANEGTFRFTGLAEGTYRVQATAWDEQGRSFVSSRETRVEAGTATANALELVLEPRK